MPRINEYPETREPTSNSYYIVQTTDGTKKITHEKLINDLIKGVQNGSN
ncbi:MAG: hypothetical protein J6Y02_11240 [Pseudobutyrivibrio sp.]|nr:hypothetical protein [Pseudobutyrivibrio sp.]